ncbi:MAG: helix-turn-helix domain-containing protein [Opitutales bacterium]|jgi:PAS domain S-box-containing protein
MQSPKPAEKWMRGVQLESVRALFEHLPGVMFFAKDAQGRFMAANLAFAQRCGCKDVASLLGRTDFDIFPVELAKAFRKKDEQILQSGQGIPRIIELFPDENGEHVWYETTKLPVLDHEGRAGGVWGTVRTYASAKAHLEPFLRVEAAAEFIKDNLGERLDIKKLARLSGLSVRQFERKFHKAYQMSPRAYLVRMRVAEACDLLRESDLRPSEIAYKSGFYDASDFSRQFRRAMKVSPTQYRRQLRTSRNA